MNLQTLWLHSNIYIDVNQLISSTSAIEFYYQNADLTEIVAVAHIS